MNGIQNRVVKDDVSVWLFSLSCNMHTVQFHDQNVSMLFKYVPLGDVLVMFVFQTIEDLTLVRHSDLLYLRFWKQLRRKGRNWLAFPREIQLYTNFEKFAGLYFPCFTTFRHKTLQFYSFYDALLSCSERFFHFAWIKFGISWELSIAFGEIRSAKSEKRDKLKLKFWN